MKSIVLLCMLVCSFTCVLASGTTARTKATTNTSQAVIKFKLETSTVTVTEQCSNGTTSIVILGMTRDTETGQVYFWQQRPTPECPIPPPVQP